MLEKAQWIGCPSDYGDVCPEFVRSFKVKQEVTSATLTVTATGVYEAHLNGKRIGDFVLAPGCTVYRQRLQYQTYDITPLLTSDNRLSVAIGTGWYRGLFSQKCEDLQATPCAVIAALTLCYADGTQESILTDDNWQVHKTNILFSDIYDGETYDATLHAATYEQACVLELSKDNLTPQEGEIVTEHERLKPISYIVTPKGERVIDFGQNMAGYVEFTVDAPEGAVVRFSHAEILDYDGNFYSENYREAKATLTYICKEGRQTYKPHFTFFGFRYIRLEEYPGEVNIDNFTAIAVYSDIKRTGYIRCSNQNLNQLFSNTLWSQRSNFVDLPTDCPQRNERLGWTGDAQVFAKTACYNYDVQKFFRKWLADLRAEQRENGSIPDIIPNFWNLTTASTAWADAITIIPWQLYLSYGDATVLSENFEAMKKWVDYMTGDTLDPYLWTCAEDDKCLWAKHYGDWLALDAPYGSYKGSTDDNLIASAFYAHSTDLLVKSGKVLGKDMSEYEQLYKNIVAAFKKRFTTFDTQTGHVLALYFHLTDTPKEVAAGLVKMIRDNGNKLQTGFVGTPYLLHVLRENGYADVAYDLLLQTEYPSWLYEVTHGATTIWEHWDGIREDGTIWSKDMNSYNHYAYGSVIDWIYTVAAGIKPCMEAPGFAKLIIAPTPDARLEFLDVSYDTKYGTVRSRWMYRDNAVRYEISTPTPATIVIAGKSHDVECGDYVFYEKE